MRHPFRVVLCLGLCLATPAQEKKLQLADLLAVQEGKMPIILSAPHGGQAQIPGVPERKTAGLPKGGKGFVTARDTGTEELAFELAKMLEKKLGHKPYLVAARFHRKFLDPNRPPEIAYDNANAQPVYDAYHQTLSRYCRAVQKEFGRGLLLDIHGQGAAADTIFRGTQNGKTVALLVQRFGPKAHVGPESFFGLLAKHGLKAHPLDSGPEQAGFTGGHIVQTYGSHTAHGIDAIQLEFGGDFRTAAKRKDTAARLAAVIEEFARRYLPAAGKREKANVQSVPLARLVAQRTAKIASTSTAAPVGKAAKPRALRAW